MSDEFSGAETPGWDELDSSLVPPGFVPPVMTATSRQSATAAWGQSWRVAVAELILLADTPTDERLNALRRYLALKHGLAVPTESDGGIVATLTAMGVDTDGLFNSVFLVK